MINFYFQILITEDHNFETGSANTSAKICQNKLPQKLLFGFWNTEHVVNLKAEIQYYVNLTYNILHNNMSIYRRWTFIPLLKSNQ